MGPSMSQLSLKMFNAHQLARTLLLFLTLFSTPGDKILDAEADLYFATKLCKCQVEMKAAEKIQSIFVDSCSLVLDGLD